MHIVKKEGIERLLRKLAQTGRTTLEPELCEEEEFCMEVVLVMFLTAIISFVQCKMLIIDVSCFVC